jgi:hypothetical protein
LNVIFVVLLHHTKVIILKPINLYTTQTTVRQLKNLTKDR